MTHNRNTSNDLGRRSGQASGRHVGVNEPADVNRMEDRLGQVDLEGQGRQLEDRMRDRHSKGVAGDYDDSVGGDADRRYPGSDEDAPR